MIAVPRPAATVLLVRDDPFEVLMVRRSATGSFASALVFPGGTADAEDGAEGWLPYLSGADDLTPADRALRIAACREIFEEVGMLIVEGAITPLAPCAGDFRAAVVASGGCLPLDRLIPFARWITPEDSPKRWDTHFFLCPAPVDQQAVCDTVETVEAVWVDPATAAADAETRGIVFPTRLNLARLAESLSVAEALTTAADRPRVTIVPVIERRADGAYSVIPADAGYGVTEGAVAR